jgi:pheromone shutdown protein TraB
LTSSTSGQAIQNTGSFTPAKSFCALTIRTTRANFTAAKLIGTTIFIIIIIIIICWVVGHDLLENNLGKRFYYNGTTAELDRIKIIVTCSLLWGGIILED